MHLNVCLPITLFLAIVLHPVITVLMLVPYRPHDQIQGKRGLILNSALKELTHKCEPIVRVTLEDEHAQSEVSECAV